MSMIQEDVSGLNYACAKRFIGTSDKRMSLLWKNITIESDKVGY